MASRAERWLRRTRISTSVSITTRTSFHHRFVGQPLRIFVSALTKMLVSISMPTSFTHPANMGVHIGQFVAITPHVEG